jgi:hypothetical protein
MRSSLTTSADVFASSAISSAESDDDLAASDNHLRSLTSSRSEVRSSLTTSADVFTSFAISSANSDDL